MGFYIPQPCGELGKKNISWHRNGAWVYLKSAHWDSVSCQTGLVQGSLHFSIVCWPMIVPLWLSTRTAKATRDLMRWTHLEVYKRRQKWVYGSGQKYTGLKRIQSCSCLDRAFWTALVTILASRGDQRPESTSKIKSHLNSDLRFSVQQGKLSPMKWCHYTAAVPSWDSIEVNRKFWK